MHMHAHTHVRGLFNFKLLMKKKRVLNAIHLALKVGILKNEGF